MEISIFSETCFFIEMTISLVIEKTFTSWYFQIFPHAARQRQARQAPTGSRTAPHGIAYCSATKYKYTTKQGTDQEGKASLRDYNLEIPWAEVP